MHIYIVIDTIWSRHSNWQSIRLWSVTLLFVANCKAAAKETRAAIANRGGLYLFPLLMTGETPYWLREQIGQAQTKEIVLTEVADKFRQAKRVGQGFVVLRQMSHTLAHDLPFTWQEQGLVSQSASLAKEQQAGLEKRWARTAEELQCLRPNLDETTAVLDERIAQILAKRNVASYFDVKVLETIQIRKQKFPQVTCLGIIC